MDTGYNYEGQESQETLHDPELRISATCDRVPVYVSHRLAVHLEFDAPYPWARSSRRWRPRPA